MKISQILHLIEEYIMFFEWVVLPPSNSKDVIPLDATDNTNCRWEHNVKLKFSTWKFSLSHYNHMRKICHLANFQLLALFAEKCLFVHCNSWEIKW